MANSQPPQVSATSAASEALTSVAESQQIASVAQAEMIVKAQTTVAMQFPRDAKAVAEEMLLCTTMVIEHDWKKGMYIFPRGGTEVMGIAAPLARDLAVCYGNCDFGFDILEMTDKEVLVMGTFIDFQKNVRIRFPSRFAKLIYRKADGWIVPDERDLRELVNKQGAIATRNAILSGIPEYIVRRVQAHALVKCREVAHGDLQKNREQVVKNLLSHFEKMGIAQSVIETKLGHEITDINGEELATLRSVYASIKDGNSEADEYFASGPVTFPDGKKDSKRKDGGKTLNDLKDGVQGKPATKKPAAKKETEAKKSTAAKPFISGLAEDKRPMTIGDFIVGFINANHLDIMKVCDKGGFAEADLQEVIAGNVVPGDDYADIIADGLKLKGEDAEYFKALVESAGTDVTDEPPATQATTGPNGDLFE